MEMRKSEAEAEKIHRELETIRRTRKGVLEPRDVVDYARKHKRSVLHQQFEWDDTTAAEQFRLVQARGIIKVHVQIIPREDTDEQIVVCSYTSLSDHRGQGYEATVDVLEDDGRRAVMLIDTIRRLMGIKEVRLFAELDGVSEAIERAAAIHLPPSRPKRKRKGGSKGRRSGIAPELRP